MDVVFVLDDSQSIKRPNWRFVTGFVASVATFLDIGLNDSLIGVISFGGDAVIQFNAREYDNQTSLIEAIHGIRYRSSRGTRTWLALNLLRETSLNGTMMLRENYPHIAVVLTDGRSRNHNFTNMAAQQLHDANIFNQIYTIGIGAKQIDVSELQSIASDDSHVYILQDFDQSLFIELRQNITQQVCPLCKPIN